MNRTQKLVGLTLLVIVLVVVVVVAVDYAPASLASTGWHDMVSTGWHGRG